MQVLMLSSSRYRDTPYLKHALPLVDKHLSGASSLLFIPYAGVGVNWDDYTAKVQTALPNYQVNGLHHAKDPVQAIQQAEAIAVGGGNTFSLLNLLYQQDLLGALRDAVTNATPYLGWSAGANICGATIKTTNDMPIIEPPSFDALKLVPFQLNPHYTDHTPPGHNGETRAQRLSEFSALNPQVPIVGLPEGTALWRHNHSLTYLGHHQGWLFTGNEKKIIAVDDDLSFLLSPEH